MVLEIYPIAEKTEIYFSFANLTDTYEFLKVSYSAYNQYNQVVAEGI